MCIFEKPSLQHLVFDNGILCVCGGGWGVGLCIGHLVGCIRTSVITSCGSHNTILGLALLHLTLSFHLLDS